MKLRVFLCITLVCYGLTLFGQNTGSQNCSILIKGKIVDTDTKQPLAGTIITNSQNKKSIVSGNDGSFALDGLCEGAVTIAIKAEGYDPFGQHIQVRRNAILNFSLHRKDIKLNEVEVTGHRSPVSSANTSATVSGKELDQTRGGSLAEALKGISGVNMLQTGATIAKPVIHGLHSNRILTLNNGIRQEGQQWGSEHAPEIDPFIARQITVIKGAESIRYGAEAIGGVVLVETPPLPNTADIHAELNLAGASNGRSGTISGMVSGGLDKLPGFGWRLQGTLKKGGNVKSADYYLENTGLNEVNFSAAAGYNTQNFENEIYYSHFQTELGIFTGAHIGNINDLMARIEYGRPLFDGDFSYSIEAPMQKVKHDLLKVKSHFHLPNGASVNAVYGFQNNNRREFDLRRALNGTPSLNLKLSTHTLDLNMEHLNSAGIKTSVGINGQMQVNNNVPGTGVTPMIPNYDSYGAGLYGMLKLFKRNYELEAGARYDYKYLDASGYNRLQELYGGSHNFNNISFSLGGVMHINNNFHVRSNFGTAWRPPVVSELYSDGLHHGTGSYERGDSSLVSERAFKWINSVEYSGNKLSFNADVYLNFIKDYIYLSPSGIFFENIRGSFPVFSYKQTDARFIGLDLTANYQLTSFLDYELKGSLVRAKDTKNERYLPWIPSDRIENALKFKVPTVAGLSDNYLQVQYQYVAEQKRYDEGSDFTPPPAAYHLFNFNMGTQWATSPTNSLSLNFSINNLTNKLYKEYMNRFRYFVHDTGRNFVLRATYRI